eukprot:CCRYP_014349-RA/>CCRYP_014349-RA protein AED:0.16 eAED:0.16 QI:0/0/0/1/1/1/3/0/1022
MPDLRQPYPQCLAGTAGLTDSEYGRDTPAQHAPTKRKGTRIQQHIQTRWEVAWSTRGASGHYFQPEAPLTKINAHAPRTTIRTATGQPLYSTGTATLNLPIMPLVNQQVHIVPGLTHNLISIGTLCDAGCTALFTANALMVTDPAGTTVLSGACDTNAPRLWNINLLSPQNSIALHVARPCATVAPTTGTQPPPTHHKKAPADILSPTHTATPTTCPHLHTHLRTRYLPTTGALVAFLHATAGYPVKSTWLQAIQRGFYNSWPGLIYKLVAKYCPTADDTIQGHMAQPRQHIRSTNRATYHQPASPASSQHDIDIFTIPLNKIFTDDTGSFHPRARSGNQYIMIAFHADTNAILVRPFPNTHDVHHITACQDIHARLCNANCKPLVHILDNEASLAFRQAITSNGCTFQLVPPHVHHRNAAERTIHTFKDHFLAILAGTAPSFPARRWDLLIPHAELTLNLLRASHCNLTLSAWEDLVGPFNFDAIPLGPAGYRILIHSKQPHGAHRIIAVMKGFILDQHFTTIAATASSTKNSEDKIIAALQQLQLATKLPTAQLQAIYKLRDIFRHYTTTAANPDPTHPSVKALPPQVQPELPVRDTTLDPAPTTAWRTVPEHTRRGHHTTVDQPIAARTRARLLATDPSCYSFAALAETTDKESNRTTMPMLDQDTGQFLEHKQLRRHPKHKATWDALYSNELGRLCQGIGHHPQYKHKKRVEGTNTFKPIQYKDIPPQRKGDVTYTRVVCKIRPQKADPYCTRITLGGDHIRYPGDCGTKTSSLETIKLLLNSVLSTPTARFASFDISNFYLGTPLDRPEYAHIKLSDIPDDFVQEYSFRNFAHNGYVYFEVTKGVYGLKQAGKLAKDLLTQRLEMHGYYQCATTPGLWRHKWQPVLFVLIVDDFGIQYSNRRHAEHLLQALQQHYTVTTDWTGTKFAGIDIKWDYNKRTCRLTMDTYISALLLKCDHPRPRKPQHAPHKHREIIYGAKEQLLPDRDTSPPLDAAGIKRIQGIVGSLLYYARAVDNKL